MCYSEFIKHIWISPVDIGNNHSRFDDQSKNVRQKIALNLCFIPPYSI